MVILVYDVTSEESFLELEEIIRNKDLRNKKVYLVGTKSDLVAKREVDFERAMYWAKENSINHIREVSSKTGFNFLGFFP